LTQKSSHAFFQIGKPFKFEVYNEEDNKLYPCFTLLDSNSKVVGWVQLHADNAAFNTERGRHEFVIISENQRCGDKDKDRELEKNYVVFKLYNVLLIEWRDKVAYRLGLGRV